jgi:hypothetical protein
VITRDDSTEFAQEKDDIYLTEAAAGTWPSESTFQEDAG